MRFWNRGAMLSSTDTIAERALLAIAVNARRSAA